MDDEKQALLEFKHGLIDGAGRLASWVREENSDCCKWAGIVCDNITGHVHKIHLPGNFCDYNIPKTREECLQQKLKGNLSPSLLNLKQLNHLDLSGNDFGGKQVPIFMGSLINLRYLKLSCSGFSGTIPPQLGNLSELRFLGLGNFNGRYCDNQYETFNLINMQWLSGLRFLHHLDMSGLNLSKAIDWLQVINTLPSLVELHLRNSKLMHIHPHVASLNLTSLSLLDLSENRFYDMKVSVPQWLFSLTGLVSLDLSWCGFHGPIPSSSEGFHNMTSLEFLHVSRNNFMNSSFVLKGLSGSNTFGNISLTTLLESFFECKSPSLESISLECYEHVPLQTKTKCIVGVIPYSIGRLSFLKHLDLYGNLISGQIPDSIGRLSLLKFLRLDKNLISEDCRRWRSLAFDNQLNGSLPTSLGLLSNLRSLDISYNLLTGIVTEAHFTNLNKLKYLRGSGNNLILRPSLADWHPCFQLKGLSLNSWNIGPLFPLWLLKQSNLMGLEISNTRISFTMPLSFWRLFPNLHYLDLSQNDIQGRLLGIPSRVSLLNVSYNQFSGELPELSNGSLAGSLDLSYNSFVGLLHHLICPYGGKELIVLNLANNHLSGAIPNQCWENFQILTVLSLENNNLSGQIPRNLGYLSSLQALNMCDNKLSGRLPTFLKKLRELWILQLARNKFIGRIPALFGTELSENLRILNLRSNQFNGNIPHELCYLSVIQILDLAHNNLSGNIPRCFNNFSVLSGKQETVTDGLSFLTYGRTNVLSSASLVIKGREDTYSTILGLVTNLDLSNNNFDGSIPSELMDLRALQALNLSRNQLISSIPKNIGDMQSLVSFDVSLNRLSGELPVSLSSLHFLSHFNVSYNSFTGKIPTSTQLQSLDNSSFVGNKLCGEPLIKSCAVPRANHEEKGDELHAIDWGLIISMVCGFIAGFWVVIVPLMVSTTWRIAYFGFLRELRNLVSDVIRKYSCHMFQK
ncbi:hypothetical protein R6Q59_009106 [Mikania micrantha]